MLVITHDCPRCSTKAAAFRIHTPGMEFGDRDHQRLFDALATCLVCMRSVVATVAVSGRLEDATTRGLEVLAMVPKPVDTAAPSNTPENVARFYKQGMENLAKNWDAAGTMFRKALEAGLKTKWPTISGSLFNRIDEVAKLGGLTEDMKEWAHKIRLLGNDAAHEEDPVDQKHARDLATFTRLFLLYTYTLPAMLDEAQEPDNRTDL